ncbi:hypothetical protein HW561_06290 [Rhodobacteraceae bacterium B1Z28]|uniref:Gluconate 2-dehydrogenase subunit 3-like protein n=1 Tax=Ruegeria haliotis TaxID=2747601 RepID=A0ABX2PMN8_9RHOB|nr:hypothetical protein [Ruegeria haliotis]NVO55395.1 hypothetical protein [Ruegeria haliotis]
MIRAALSNIEKIIVTVTSLAALVPITQFARESEDRRFERMASFIALGDTCSDWMQDEVIEGMAFELKHYVKLEEDGLAPIPVQVRANQVIYCSYVLDYFQAEFQKIIGPPIDGTDPLEDILEPTADEYLAMLFYASHWAVPIKFEDYLVGVRNVPNSAGTHAFYETQSPWWESETVDDFLDY